MANKSLATAKDAKNDEFYTELYEIQSELSNYVNKFEGKVVFCNCDDPFESNFVKYFLMNFNRFKLKELIATGYKTSPIAGKELATVNIPYALRVTNTTKYLVGTQTDLDIRGAIYFLQTEGSNIMTPLFGNKYIDENKQEVYYEAGDFRSEMCIELLKESDIVCTNPPFSLFREYIAQLIKYKKQFLIIGNKNAATYKDFFSLLKSNQVWFGYNSPTSFILPDGTHTKKVTGLTRWFTNIDHIKRHQMLPLDLGCTYENYKEQYPKYDNYNAIEVNKVQKIPCDYKGVMGVPPTFFDKYCPEQFEILGKTKLLDWANSDDCDFFTPPSKELQEYYKSLDKTWRVQNAYILVNGKPLDVYDRIFIKFTSSYIQTHPEQFNQGDC